MFLTSKSCNFEGGVSPNYFQLARCSISIKQKRNTVFYSNLNLKRVSVFDIHLALLN